MPRKQPAPRDYAQPGWLEPELATLTHHAFSDPGWVYERKFDGERCLAYRCGREIRLMTRNRQQVNSTYPELDEALGAQDADNFIVDGEVVAFAGRTTSFARYYDRHDRLAYAGKVGTGFDAATLADLHRRLARLEREHPPFACSALPTSRVHWVEPRLVGQVGFSEWTRAGQLRHPRYLGLRRDKDPASVTREESQQGAKP